MIAKDDYDLAKPLLSALRAKAPFVGIPIPGQRPLIFRRAFLAKVLRGLDVMSIAVDNSRPDDYRFLVIEGFHSCTVHSKMRLRSLERHKIYNDPEFRNFRDSGLKKPKAKVSKLDQAIARARKEAKWGDEQELISLAALLQLKADENRKRVLARKECA